MLLGEPELLLSQRIQRLSYFASHTKILAGAGVLLLGSSNSLAQPQSDHVQIEAQTQYEGILPGESGILAVRFGIDEDWHIYWPGVSDSGYGVSLNIHTTGPITLEEPIWPTPTRHLQPGDILDNIYEDGAMVLIPFHVAQDAATDDAIFFDIESEFLVCSSICLPGQASTSTTISILDESSEKLPTPSSKQIQEAFTHRPKLFDPKADDVRLQWASNAAAVMFRDATKIEFFPSKQCSELADPIKGSLVDGNRLIIKFTQSQGKVLSGRLRVDQPNGTVDYDIDIKQPD